MGREFDELFNQWAPAYDDFVLGKDEQYKEVFENYGNILEEVANRSYGHVLEFGVGTGNLTKKLIQHGVSVTGIEPAKEMRKIATEKIGEKIRLQDGDFFHFPTDQQIDCIVSTYAFHHLTDMEKEEAVSMYTQLLPPRGKIIFADTMFETVDYYLQLKEEMKIKGYNELVDDLNREYYPLIGTMVSLVAKNGFSVFIKKMNRYVWLMEAVKE
ncbi:MAG: class I SAM-dependent DNA methyltransferase [Bacillaceae bacterium]